MAALDTLEILIEADRSGLESQLKRAGDSVLQFVNKMNTQKVNWMDVLTKTLTPTVIGFIASSIAVGITQALKFQQALITSGQNASEGFKENTGAISDAVLGMSKTNIYSADEIASAFGMVNSVFKDTTLATGILGEITDVAASRHADLIKTTELLVPLLEHWGISTVPQAEDAMSKLNYATKLGDIGFAELIKTLTDTGAVLSTKTNVSLGDTALQLEEIQNKTGMTSDAVVDTFQKIADAVAVPGSKLEVLTVGFGKMGSTIDKEGITGAFEAIDKRIFNAGVTGKLLAQDMGLVNDAIAKFASTAPKAFEDAGEAAKKAALNIPSLTQQSDAAKTATDELTIAWNKFSTDMTQIFVPALGIGKDVLVSLMGFFDQAAQGYQDLIDTIANQGLGKALKDSIEAPGEASGLTDFFQSLMDNGPSSFANVAGGGKHLQSSDVQQRVQSITVNQHNVFQGTDHDTARRVGRSATEKAYEESQGVH